eukprot:m.345650 g.345650  ORF g.345650 m.345650 type:complete len:84 (-) comp20666_c0_seq25:209-460(-)
MQISGRTNAVYHPSVIYKKPTAKRTTARSVAANGIERMDDMHGDGSFHVRPMLCRTEIDNVNHTLDNILWGNQTAMYHKVACT